MQALTQAEINEVRGGIELVDAAAIITSLSLYSPVTMAFGLPNAGALITLDLMNEN